MARRENWSKAHAEDNNTAADSTLGTTTQPNGPFRVTTPACVRGGVATGKAFFAQVPISLWEDHSTTRAEYKVYIYLDHKAGRRGVWYCGQADIAEETALSPRSVRAATKRLEQRGHITMQRLGSDHATRIEYTIVARVRKLHPSERHATSAQSPPPSGRADPRRSEAQCRSERKHTSPPYKEPQIPPQIPTTDQETPLTPRVRGEDRLDKLVVRAERAREGSKRKRDRTAADQVFGGQDKYYSGRYGAVLRQREEDVA